MTSTLPDTQKTTDERWRFWRDVPVFELKMFIGNLRDLALMPVSVVAAMIDLVSKGEREGSLFYRVLRWGAHSEEILDEVGQQPELKERVAKFLKQVALTNKDKQTLVDWGFRLVEYHKMPEYRAIHERSAAH